MSLKNWDNKTWLSSRDYIFSFNNFLLKNIDLNQNSQILDIGCGRGKILGNLASKLRLKKRPIGIDIELHKDKDKRIIFKKVDAIKYLLKNEKKFDLILIKQTIHLLEFKEIRRLLFLCTKRLQPGGKVMIFTLETSQNEIPTFFRMKKKLKISLNRDKQILQFISKLHPNNLLSRFSFKVKITRRKYIKMIKNRYISTLLNFNAEDISKGITEINARYKEQLQFNDKLICLILNK